MRAAATPTAAAFAATAATTAALAAAALAATLALAAAAGLALATAAGLLEEPLPLALTGVQRLAIWQRLALALALLVPPRRSVHAARSLDLAVPGLRLAAPPLVLPRAPVSGLHLAPQPPPLLSKELVAV